MPHLTDTQHMPSHILKPKKTYELCSSEMWIQRKCRDVGIQRWPYRKLLSLQKLINHFQQTDIALSTHPNTMPHLTNTQHMPSHILKLKKNLRIVLIRNVDPTKGLCIGTHLIIKRTSRLVIEAEIITGSNIGDTVLIPRMTFTITMERWPFKMKCTQFPIKICQAEIIAGEKIQELNE
ncbi:hypothetical protein CTI12_AA487090 [Artemisia annua]|uniref:RWP-RK domain-containing protein n=1 Tax=Artemisia annua TaxID=35608 RepID=A0A2U1LIQ5_ARTAN|nr:hypothetical protein CTI12_AA487090 [Artemisia annua]